MNQQIKLQEYYLGFNIGGTKCSIALGDSNFKVYEKIVFDTRVERGYKEILNEFKKHVYTLFKSYEQQHLVKIGISCGGPLDSKKGIIKSPPNLPGWDAVAIVAHFKYEFKVEVSLQNDANACAIAEWSMGAGRGTQNMIFLTFGTGMGAGLILNGQIYSGTNDYAGEIGHVRMAEDGPIGYGKAGSFEGFCSGGGIAQLAKSMASQKIEQGQQVSFCTSKKMLDTITAASVFEAAVFGDEVAMEIVKTSASYLAKGLSILIDILNPERIVIGSIYARNEKMFLPLIKEILVEETLSEALQVCKIVPAKLGEEIGDYAALCVALHG